MKLCQMARDGKKRRKLACMARFFAVRQQGGEASGHAYNRRTLSGRYVRIQKKGLSPKRKPLNLLERETGFEPATSTLARLHSTTELLPRGMRNDPLWKGPHKKSVSACGAGNGT